MQGYAVFVDAYLWMLSNGRSTIVGHEAKKQYAMIE